MPLNTVGQLKLDVSRILTGIDLDEVADVERSFQNAVSTTIQKAPVLEASGRQSIMLYDRVTTYNAPDTIFGGALIDIRPQGIDRMPWDDVEKTPIVRFDLGKTCVVPSGYRVTFESRKKNLLMRIAQNFSSQAVTLDSMDDTTGWALTGAASGLAKDTTVFYHSPASLRFNLTASSAGMDLTKTLNNSLDLSSFEGVGVVFLAIYMPNQTATSPIVDIALTIGSSPADTYSVTVTQGFLGEFYANDFLLVAFDLSLASQSGTPDFSKVNYIDIAIDSDGTATPNVRVGDLWIALPSAHEVLFYSPAVFVHNDGDASSIITDDTDEILFHNAAYNIYVQEAAREVAKNQGGDISSGLIAAIDLVLEGNAARGKVGLYGQYRGDNPSEELRQVGSYYDIGRYRG